MGFLRKALFVGTGGASGLVVKANSKKERTAKALEQQSRLMTRGDGVGRNVVAPNGNSQRPERATSPLEPVFVTFSLADELAKIASLHDQGALDDEEFDAAKQQLLGSPSSIEALAPEDSRSGIGATIKAAWAEGTGAGGIRGAIREGAAEGRAKAKKRQSQGKEIEE